MDSSPPDWGDLQVRTVIICKQVSRIPNPGAFRTRHDASGPKKRADIVSAGIPLGLWESVGCGDRTSEYEGDYIHHDEMLSRMTAWF